MKDKINVAELLKDCPKDMELYSPLCGKCFFDRLNMGTIICKKQNTQEITFTSEGYYMLPVFDNCECMIFPSKDQRDWSKFQRPFKEGDVVISEMGNIHLLQTADSSYCSYREYLDKTRTTSIRVTRLATDEEKQQLFQAIKDNGYKWNTETKTLEKLIQPKFKVGDKIKDKNNKIWFVVQVSEKHFDISSVPNAEGYFVSIDDQDYYKLVPNKFDITTLKPFESRVLVREDKTDVWQPAIYGFFNQNNKRFYTTSTTWLMCIPYNEDTNHLLGTTNDCDAYYKNW